MTLSIQMIGVIIPIGIIVRFPQFGPIVITLPSVKAGIFPRNDMIDRIVMERIVRSFVRIVTIGHWLFSRLAVVCVATSRR